MRRRAVLSPCIALMLTLLGSASCSTTRVLSEGEYRLASNSVEFEGDADGLAASDISSYIKQPANSYFIFGWSPSLNIYNWSDPAKDDWLNNAIRKVGVAPVVFDPYQVVNSRENIARHLEYLGYYGSEVYSRVDTVRRTTKVTYVVRPGKRLRIDSLVFRVPEGEFEKEFFSDRDNILIGEGEWLSEKLLEKESERGAAYFRNLGYYDFSKFNYFFEADTLSGRNILTYRIRGHTRNEAESSSSRLQKYRIGDVSISFSSQLNFREKVIRELNVIRPGDWYSEKMTDMSYRRLSALRVFNNIGIEMIPADSAVVDCRISMGESSRQGVKFNLETSTNANGLWGISPQVNFFHKNLFHGGEWLSLGFTGNYQAKFGTDTRANEFGVNASLSFPRFLGLPYRVFKGPAIPRTEIQLSLNYQNRPEFVRWLGAANLAYVGNSGQLYYQLYPLRTTVVKVNKMSEEFSTTLLHNLYLWDSFYDHIDAGVGGQLYLTSDSDLIPKTSYKFLRFTFDLSGNAISLLNPWLPEDDELGDKLFLGLRYAQYVRAEMQLGRAFRFNPGSALAMQLSAGIGKAYGSSSSMPFERQFYVGGANSMRGWQARALGPGNSEVFEWFTIPSQTGDWKLEFDLEYRQRLFWKIEGALFAECGNVWQWDDVLPGSWFQSLAADWGIGLRVNLNFILLRVDWGAKLYEPSRAQGERFLRPSQWLGSDGCAFHFGVGYPF
ncbi:MAG: BamA/TamA family outer membrane protein [Bacteroidales bacterium]|nr:BamA/TamA family outer membrane protein [Bacteroidales bacterium]